MKSSRRRFLRLLAAGSAATAATPAAALARAAKPKGAKPPAGTRPAPPPVPAVPPAVAEEIRKQKALVEQTVRAVRDCPLPPGSEPAFVFAPLRPRRREGTP